MIAVPLLMLDDLIGKRVEVWIVSRGDGPTFDGTLHGVGQDQAAVSFLVLRDTRGLDIRVPISAVTAVVCAGG